MAHNKSKAKGSAYEQKIANRLTFGHLTILLGGLMQLNVNTIRIYSGTTC